MTPLFYSCFGFLPIYYYYFNEASEIFFWPTWFSPTAFSPLIPVPLIQRAVPCYPCLTAFQMRFPSNGTSRGQFYCLVRTQGCYVFAQFEWLSWMVLRERVWSLPMSDSPAGHSPFSYRNFDVALQKASNTSLGKKKGKCLTPLLIEKESEQGRTTRVP